MFTQSAGIQHRHTTGIHRQQAYTGIQQAAIQHMLTHTAYSILPYSDNTYTLLHSHNIAQHTATRHTATQHTVTTLATQHYLHH